MNASSAAIVMLPHHFGVRVSGALDTVQINEIIHPFCFVKCSSVTPQEHQKQLSGAR